MYTKAEARNIATYTTHLWVGGFEGESGPSYEHHAGRHSGMVGIVMDLYYQAVAIHQHIVALEQECPELWNTNIGVYEYEVVESLGAWLFDHPDAFSEGPHASVAFNQELERATNEWFDLDFPTSTNESTTAMTVTELISKLSALPGNLPVLTRGSEAQKMVDAIEVREVKTTQRKAVFIGKPKAVTAD